mgnify:FL=1
MELKMGVEDYPKHHMTELNPEPGTRNPELPRTFPRQVAKDPS